MKETLRSKKDIRIQYPSLFSDIFNNFDKVVFSRLLRDCCEEDCVVLYEYIGRSNPYGPMHVEVRQLDAILAFWDGMLSAIPDSMFTIHGTRMKILPNKFSSVVCNFTFTGTKVYAMAGMDQNAHKDTTVLVSTAEGVQNQQSGGGDGGDVNSTGTCNNNKNTTVRVLQRRIRVGRHPAALSLSPRPPPALCSSSGTIYRATLMGEL
mmetsp:Transcript_17302/g.29272  ORF Transcript_17302/g.29272 Transcript_17302/m.29272 type:complete len:207 (+) Transcript_17302:381-1001(+)